MKIHNETNNHTVVVHSQPPFSSLEDFAKSGDGIEKPLSNHWLATILKCGRKSHLRWECEKVMAVDRRDKR
jgi:hypothetical protein